MTAIVTTVSLFTVLWWWWIRPILVHHGVDWSWSTSHPNPYLYHTASNRYYQVMAYNHPNEMSSSNTTTATTINATNSNSDHSNHSELPIKPPLQVYILAGQSNMVGMGSITHLDKLIQYNGTRTNTNSSNHSSIYQNEYRDTLWNGTTYNVRDDVYIKYQTRAGKLTVSRTAGYAGGSDQFGPELLFGWTMAEQQRNSSDNGSNSSNAMILLIKVAYGGRDLAIDFRPPSAGIGNYSNVKDPDHYGWEYRTLINDTKHALDTIDQYIPNYQNLYNSTYVLKGVVWFQGWNDLLTWQKVNEYESNLAHLIRDIRTDLNHSTLPFVIGELGMHGPNPDGKEAGRVFAVRAAQQNVCLYPEFQNNTIFVPTASYAVLNGATYNGIFHYYGRADTYYHIGQAFGMAMDQMLKVQNETMPLLSYAASTTVPAIGPSLPNVASSTNTISTSRARRTCHNYCQMIQYWIVLPLLLCLLLG